MTSPSPATHPPSRRPAGVTGRRGGWLALCFLVATCCAAQQTADTLTADLRSRLERYLGQIPDSAYAFSVLVSVDGEDLVRRGYGWIDSARTRQATDRTLFNIASITKSFTAITVLALQERGLLRLDDSLPRYFDNVPADKRPVTVSQLLAHTSGLAQHYAADGITQRDSAVRSILSDTLAFAPGTGFSYSNENYELLGAIIELTDHERYEEAVRRLILRPAGMTDTRFWADTAGVPEGGIAPMTRALEPRMLTRNWGYIGSGGIYSNVTDLERWMGALRSGLLLEPGSLVGMWTPGRKLTETSVALGWFVAAAPDGGREIWTRGTEDWGHNGVVRWFPDRNILVIVLSNSGELGDKSTTANRFISDGIVKIIFEQR